MTRIGFVKSAARATRATLAALLSIALAASLASCNGGTATDSYVPNRPISATLPPYGDSQNSADAQCQHRMQDVVTLEEGRVIGRGTHEELLASCPTYREISDSQMGGAFIE